MFYILTTLVFSVLTLIYPLYLHVVNLSWPPLPDFWPFQSLTLFPQNMSEVAHVDEQTVICWGGWLSWISCAMFIYCAQVHVRTVPIPQIQVTFETTGRQFVFYHCGARKDSEQQFFVLKTFTMDFVTMATHFVAFSQISMETGIPSAKEEYKISLVIDS